MRQTARTDAANMMRLGLSESRDIEITRSHLSDNTAVGGDGDAAAAGMADAFHFDTPREDAHGAHGAHVAISLADSRVMEAPSGFFLQEEDGNDTAVEVRGWHRDNKKPFCGEHDDSADLSVFQFYEEAFFF